MRHQMKHPLSLKHIVVAISILFFSVEAIFAGLPAKPNIIFILADDLGCAEVGCCGQTKIKNTAQEDYSIRAILIPDFF